MSGLYSKFVIKEKKGDVVHSSGYGAVQNSGAMGASSGVGFTERMRINNNRSRVKRYGDSKIANQFQVSKSRATVYNKNAGDNKNIGIGAGDGEGRRTSRYSSGGKVGDKGASNVGGATGLRNSSNGARNSAPMRGFGR